MALSRPVARWRGKGTLAYLDCEQRDLGGQPRRGGVANGAPESRVLERGVDLDDPDHGRRRVTGSPGADHTRSGGTRGRLDRDGRWWDRRRRIDRRRVGLRGPDRARVPVLSGCGRSRLCAGRQHLRRFGCPAFALRPRRHCRRGERERLDRDRPDITPGLPGGGRPGHRPRRPQPSPLGLPTKSSGGHRHGRER